MIVGLDKLKGAAWVLMGLIVGWCGVVIWLEVQLSEPVPDERMATLARHAGCECAFEPEDDARSILIPALETYRRWADTRLEPAPEISRCAFRYWFESAPTGIGVKICKNGRLLGYDFFHVFDERLYEENDPSFSVALFSLNGKIFSHTELEYGLVVLERNKTPRRFLPGVKLVQDQSQAH